MAPGPHDDTIQRWVGDFCESAAFRDRPSAARAWAPEVLATFLAGAAAARGVPPGDVEEGDLRAGLLEHVAALDLPASARQDVPALGGAFLAHLEAEGRLAGGAMLGRFVEALRPAFLRAAEGRAQDLTRPGSKLGRNDPCPCGSGRKYKKCCRNLLDG